MKKQELTSVSAVAYIPLSASELARVVEVKLGGKEDSVKALGITIAPTGELFNITVNTVYSHVSAKHLPRCDHQALSM